MDIRKFFSRKRPLEKSDDDKDEVPPPKSTDQEAEGQSTTHMKTKSDSLSKAAKKLSISLALATKSIGRRSTHGFTAQKECSVVCAKVLGAISNSRRCLDCEGCYGLEPCH